jgi:predicted ATPase
MMKFTDHDRQSRDWNYSIKYKTGGREDTKHGKRKYDTKKWSGIAKKESQIKDRQVVFIDLDRVMPARNFNNKIFTIAKSNPVSDISVISAAKISEIESYMSYILEDAFTLNRIAQHLDKDIFRYRNQNEYSSFNAATGEEVLLKIIIDAVEADRNALVLIDEIEIGLHPKIQRRLLDILYHISKNENKQFILTSHSSTILSSVPDKARIFIEKQHNGTYKSIQNISVSEALSKMDSASYPLYDLFCEDDITKKIILKAISYIQAQLHNHDFGNFVNIIISGAADETYTNFLVHKNTYSSKKVKVGYACILDGDMQTKTARGSVLLYPPQDCLHFVATNMPPEYFLVKYYLAAHPNTSLQFHLDNSNVHCLFEKMVEFTASTTKNDSFEMCWKEFMITADGQHYFNSLTTFLIDTARKFSPSL